LNKENLKKEILSFQKGKNFSLMEFKANSLIQLDKEDPDGWIALAIAQRNNNKLDSSLKNFIKAKDLDNNNVEIDKNLKEIYTQLGKKHLDNKEFDLAEKYYLKLLDVLSNDNDKVECIFTIAQIYTQTSNYLKAKEYYKKVLQINPNNIGSLINLGVIEKKINIEASNEYFKRAIRIDPSSALAINNLANNYTDQGDIENAKEMYNKGSKLKDYQGITFKHYTNVEKFLSNSKYVRKIISELKSMDEMNRYHAEFGLASIYEKEENYSMASKYLISANKLKLKEIKFDREVYDQLRLINNKVKKIEYNNDSSDFNDRPIFIVGMPRSGTTLLEHIISNTKDIYGAGEVPFFLEAMHSSKVLSLLISKEEGEIDREIWSLNKDIYKSKMLEISKDKSRTIDKNWINFFYIGSIINTFPKAKIINIERNVNDNLLSIFQRLFPHGVQFSYSIEDIHFAYSVYLKSMKNWNKIYKDEIYNIKYENIINNPKKEIEELFQFLDIPFNDQVLDTQKNKRIVSTASNTQVRNKINSSSINKWKNYKPYLEELFL
tara:strand:- start:3113 stop:4759 length:1647 start_codon:yes stop_codon:yes gene_type:complete